MEPSLWHKAVLGVVQGLTEFLPISSSAHLILFPRFFGWPDQGLAFDVALHLGTLAGVVSYFWKDLWALTTPLFSPRAPESKAELKLLTCLVLATIPAVMVGLLFEKKVETVFRDPGLIAWTLIGGALLLGVADLLAKEKKRLIELNYGMAFMLGLAQSIALIPGVSRSGITITAALAFGFIRAEAARFSFLMSIPVIAGAGILKFGEILHTGDRLGVLVGFFAAALSGYVAIWGLMRYIQTRRFTPFVVYRICLGALLLIFA